MRSIAAWTSVLALCSASAAAQELTIPYERFELSNGLDVILHEDHSDPVVAVYVYYHVGSAREEVGRSGFAHLFEHLMFQGSEHVGDDQHFKLIQEAGGSLNGTTNTDRTNYFETLPSNQLELALWLEADRMGFLLPAITQEKLDNQREVVKNERRQNYENQPYGEEREILARSLYPADHPYSWLTIGSMEDLNAASLDDVTAFFRRWYGPNNATLAIGGDIDPAQARALVERYFGPIPRGPEVTKPAPRAVALEADERVVAEDDVKLPQLTIAWPTVEQDHPDEAALDLLARALTASKSSVLERALTIDAQLASTVRASHPTAELAGTFTITARPEGDVSLDDLEQRIRALLFGFAEDGIAADALERLKTVHEAGVIRGLETVSSRTSQLAQSNTFRGEPDTVAADLARFRAVTAEDVQRVLRAYLIDRPAVIVSIVPEGELELAATGRTPEQRALELALDRTQQPPAAAPRPFHTPDVWRSQLVNGVTVAGARYDELPLTTITLYVPAGRLQEDLAHLGLASLTADLLDEGTQRLTAPELEDAFDALGASFFVRSGDDDVAFSLSALDAKLEESVALFTEVLLSPRFAQEDFDRLKTERLTDIGVRADSIRAIAGDVWNALMFGPGTIEGSPSVGTAETVGALGLDDVKRFWAQHATPRGSRMVYVGARDADGVAALLAPLASSWKAPAAVEAAAPREPGLVAARIPKHAIYLVDKPGAAQTEVRVGEMSVSALDPDHDGLEVLNYILGGSFSSRINMNLREDKGYTYGARSSFSGDLRPGPFTASAGVHTAVTAPAVDELMLELAGIAEGVTEAELEFARSAMLSSMDRQFESTRALASYVDELTRYGYPDDFLLRRRELIQTVTANDLKALAREHLSADRRVVLVVGDKQEILGELLGRSYGDVFELAPDGTPIGQLEVVPQVEGR